MDGNNCKSMKPKLLLCLALVLVIFPGARTNAIVATNLPEMQIANPQESVHLPRLGSAIFRKQSSGFSLQIPIAFRKGNENILASNTNKIQAWLLKTDGTAVPQSSKPSMMNLGSIGDYSTDYLFYMFSKVPANELAGVVVSLNGKLYCRQIEMNGHEPSVAPPDANLVHISPTNISGSPLTVQTTNFDNYEHFTLLYKTDKTVSDKFLYACQELSDGDAVISSEPIAGVWTTNGVMFEFGGGYVYSFKFKIIETGHRGETPMPGYSGYWFYERDFVTNTPMHTNDIQVITEKDRQEMVIGMPGLNENISLTKQSTLYTVQLDVRCYPGDFQPWPKGEDLHRQAWLLRADGTAFSQTLPPDRAGSGNAGWSTEYLTFEFPRKAGDDAVGLVVNIGGQLYCRDIEMVGDPR